MDVLISQGGGSQKLCPHCATARDNMTCKAFLKFQRAIQNADTEASPSYRHCEAAKRGKRLFMHLEGVNVTVVTSRNCRHLLCEDVLMHLYFRGLCRFGIMSLTSTAL